MGIFKIISLLRYISNMIKRLLVILLLNRVAHSMGIRDEAKSSDVDSYSLYDSIKVSNSEASLINERKRRKVRSPQNSAAVVNIGLVQAKVNTALNNYRADIQKNMLKELKKIATEVYKELDSSSSSDSSDSDDEDSDDEDVIQWDDIVQATRSPLFQQDDDEEDDSDDQDSDDEEEEEEDKDEEEEDEEDYR